MAFYSKKSEPSWYSKKLLDPQWQKKRLEIFQRDNFTCKRCDDANKTLHVHHKYYEYNLLPWEYPDESLVTLCCDCHEEEQSALNDLEKALLLILKKGGFMSNDFIDLYETFNSVDVQWFTQMIHMITHRKELFNNVINVYTEYMNEKSKIDILPNGKKIH